MQIIFNSYFIIVVCDFCYVIIYRKQCDRENGVQAAFPLRKFFKESLTHGPLNLCVNEKTVGVNE